MPYEKLKDELGDILHLVFTVIGELDLDPDEIIEDNLLKVGRRRAEGYYGGGLQNG